MTGSPGASFAAAGEGVGVGLGVGAGAASEAVLPDWVSVAGVARPAGAGVVVPGTFCSSGGAPTWAVAMPAVASSTLPNVIRIRMAVSLS